MTPDPRDPRVRRSIELMPAERQHPAAAARWAVTAIQDIATNPESDRADWADDDARWLGRFLYSLYRLHVERGDT